MPKYSKRLRVVYISDIEDVQSKDTQSKSAVYTSDIDCNEKSRIEHMNWIMFQKAMKSDPTKTFASTFPRGYYRRDSIEYGPDNWVQMFKVAQGETIEQAAKKWIDAGGH
jgi:hypothetical protein